MHGSHNAADAAIGFGMLVVAAIAFVGLRAWLNVRLQRGRELRVLTAWGAFTAAMAFAVIFLWAAQRLGLAGGGRHPSLPVGITLMLLAPGAVLAIDRWLTKRFGPPER
jgi:hypothetical protein